MHRSGTAGREDTRHPHINLINGSKLINAVALRRSGSQHALLPKPPHELVKVIRRTLRCVLLARVFATWSSIDRLTRTFITATLGRVLPPRSSFRGPRRLSGKIRYDAEAIAVQLCIPYARDPTPGPQ